MLLKRQEKENVIKAIYKSSNILASTYNKETSDLTLIFNKGGQYKYPNVKLTDYSRFEIAESQGVIFNSHIKPYSFEKLPTIDPKDIIAEVNKLYEEEKKALIAAKQLRLVNLMTALVGSSETPFTEPQLEQVRVAITEYLLEKSK